MPKWIKWTGISCALLIAACLPGYIATRSDPVDGLDDADLSVNHEIVRPPEDGLTHLLAAVQVCEFDDSDRTFARAAWSDATTSTRDIHALLDLNREALQRLRRALDAPHFRLPELAADELDVVPEIPVDTESLVELLQLEALSHARASDWDAAFDSAIDILRFAQRIEGANHAALTTTMLSVGYRAAGLETLRKLTALAPLENAQARRWVEVLPSFRSDPSAWKRMWAVEYQQWKSLLEWITERAENDFRRDDGSNDIPEFTLIDIAELRQETRRTLEAFADMTRSFQRASERDCSDMTTIPVPRSDANDTTSAPTASGAGTSGVGIDIPTPDYRDFFIQRCAEDTALAATQTLIALRAFHQDNGRLPDRLNELVPTYLAAIPTDSFGGEPIRYSRADKLVYSLAASAGGPLSLEDQGTAGADTRGESVATGLRFPIEF